MGINGKIIEELSKKGIDLELVTRLMGDFLSDRKDVFISKEEETEYMACEKYYKENEEVLKGIYNISGIYNRHEAGDNIGISGYGFYIDFLTCNGEKFNNKLEMLKGLVKRKDEYEEWNNIRQEIYNRCVMVDNRHRFRIIHGIGLLLSGSGWEKDMKWLVKMGKKYKGGILLESIETAGNFRDLIRFRGLLGGANGSMKALKELGDMYDILDENDVRVLKRIIKKYDDKKRAFLGNERKRKVMG